MSCWPRAGSRRPPQARTMRRACAAPRPRLWTRPAGCSTRCDPVNWGTRPAAKCTPTPAVLGTAARHSFALAGCSRDRTAMTYPDWPDGPRDRVGYDAGPPPEGPLGVGYGSVPQPDDPRHNVGYGAGPPPDGPRDDAGYGAGPPPDGPRDDAGYGVVPQPDGPADPAPVTSTPSTSGGHRRPRRGRGRYVAAGVVLLALIAGVVIWAPWRKPPLLQPTGLAPGARTTSSVAFHWSGPATGPSPDKYLLPRDGNRISCLPSTATTSHCTDRAPNASYRNLVATCESGK